MLIADVICQFTFHCDVRDE